MPEKIAVRWYNCNCEWVSKYCDKHHTEVALIPKDVLKQYTKEETA